MNYTTLVIFALFFAVIGFVVALLIMRLREPDPTSLAELRDQRRLDEPLPSPSARSGALQVWRDPHSGKIYVEMDGQVYDAVSQMSQEQRSALSARTGELVNWLSQAAPQATPSAIRPVQAPRRTPPPAASRGVQPGTPASRSILSRAMQPRLSRQKPKTASLAEQVDEILQERLAGSPLARRHIRLIDLLDHGLAVEVDQNQFDSIDEVPEEDVRQFIKEAVAEWQRRSRNGGN